MFKVIEILRSQGLKPTFEKIINRLKSANIEATYNPIGYSNAGIIVSKGRYIESFNVGDRVACGGNAFAVHGWVDPNFAIKFRYDGDVPAHLQMHFFDDNTNWVSLETSWKYFSLLGSYRLRSKSKSLLKLCHSPFIEFLPKP